MYTQDNSQQTRFSLRLLLLLVIITTFCSVKANDYNKYVGEEFYLPYPSLSLSNAVVYAHTYDPTTHIDIINSESGVAKITSYFTGSEYVTCNIYYYIQSASGNRTFGRTAQSHRVTCKGNNITISSPRSEINVNEGVQLTYRFDNSYFASNAKITYQISSASPSGCVSVSSSGYVTGKSAGTATIQAQSNLSDNVSSLTIRVKTIDPTSVYITPNPASVYCDASQPMYASVSPSGASQRVTWSMYSGSSSIATINSSGVVYGYMPGEITVKATAENGVYGLRTVTIKEPSFTRENTNPSNNATNQNVFIKPSVTFSHTLYKGTNFGSITLKSALGDYIDGVAKMSGKSIVFQPARPLSANTKYTLTIPANSVKNKWGTNYSDATTLTFTTGNLEKLNLSVSSVNKFIKDGTALKLVANQANATIYYTLDGTTPTEKSTRYTDAITIKSDVALRAIAILEGYENSDVLAADYILSNVNVLKKFPVDEEPMYIYADAFPLVSFSNIMEPSSKINDVELRKDGVIVDVEAIVTEKTLFIVPTEPLELGCKYSVNVPADAVKTWQGESCEKVSWSFNTCCFATDVAIGNELAAAVMTDGSLWTWGQRLKNANTTDGSYEYIPQNVPTSFVASDVVAVSAGYMHHALLKRDGSLWMWGRQLCGEFGNGSTAAAAEPIKVMENVKSVNCGLQLTAIVKNDGSLWMCGRNDLCQIDSSYTVKTSFVKVAEDVSEVDLQWGGISIVKNDRSIVTRIWNDTIDVLRKPESKFDDAVYVAYGWKNSIAMDNASSVWTWGCNDNGTLGVDDLVYSVTPMRIIEGRKSSILSGLTTDNISMIPINLGEKTVLLALPYPLDADYDSISWNSSDSQVVRVSDRGVLYGNSKGMATVEVVIFSHEGKSFKKDFRVLVGGASGIPGDIVLNNGWNWVSFNMESDALANVNSTLASGNWTVDDEIKNGKYSDSYSEIRNKWFGTLSRQGKIDNKSMYKIHSSQNQLLSLGGEAINLSDNAITVGAGWNYIGYLPMVDISLADALADYNALAGDVIKSQNAFATYSASNGWEGDLTTMEVGKGYMLKRNATAGQTSFHYPVVYNTTNSSSARRARMQYYEFPDNMNVIGQVCGINTEEGDSIVALVGAQTRGAGVVDEYGKVYLTIQGDDKAKATIVLQRKGEIIATANSPIMYQSNLVLGSADKPTKLDFVDNPIETNVEQIIAIYNTNGILMRTNTLSMVPPGTYIIYSIVDGREVIRKYFKK